MNFTSSKSMKIYVAGHNGMVGSAILRGLKRRGYTNIIYKTRDELDLLNQSAVAKFMQDEQPEYIFVAAAKVGGINANNTSKAEFIYQNLVIESNIIHSAHLANVNRLCFLGSSCIYPRDCPQPIKEEFLLTGSLEKTNEPYAIAKIAGVKLCESYNEQYGRQYNCLMPCNLYGPNDNYDLNSCHVLPALIRKAHIAKINNNPTITIWGSGTPRREFLHVDDLADGCIFIMESGYYGPLLNIGSGIDVSINQLVSIINDVVGYHGTLIFDHSKPDGTPRKLLDVTKINKLGFHSRISLPQGIKDTYSDFLNRGIK